MPWQFTHGGSETTTSDSGWSGFGWSEVRFGQVRIVACDRFAWLVPIYHSEWNASVWKVSLPLRMLIHGRTSILALRHQSTPPNCGAARGGIPFTPWDAAVLLPGAPRAFRVLLPIGVRRRTFHGDES